MEAKTSLDTKNGFSALLQYRSFLLIWLGNTVSRFGDAVDSIAFMWMIYKMTGSFVMMGTIMAVNALPSLLFGIPAGVFVDRMNKKQVMIISDLLRGMSTFIIALLFITGNLEIYYLYIFTFFNSCCEVFAHPARASAMQVLVRKEHYLAANSLREASTSAAQIIGTGIAALILGVYGIGTAVLVDASTFFFSAATAFFAHIETVLEENRKTMNTKVFFAELKEGIAVIRSRSVLFISVLMAAWVNLMLAPFNLLVPVYSDKILMAGAKGYSLIEMAFTIGVIIGSVLVGQIGHKFKKSKLIIAGFAALGIGIGSLGFIRHLYSAVLVCVFAGVFLPFISAGSMTIVQETTPRDKMGRISSTLGTLCMLGMPVGYAVSGFIAEGLNIQTTYIVIGALICMVTMPVLFIKDFFKY